MQKIVSIIVPMYNSERTIHRTIQSVLDQSYSGWELLLIDDGSTDNTKLICENYVKQNSKIMYVYKKNSGPSDTRNRGIELAKGDYISFLDSDDEYKANFLEVMTDCAIASNCDIVMCAFEKVYDDTNKQDIIHRLPVNRVLQGQESAEALLKDLLCDCYGGTPSLWNKLYKRSFINERNIRLESWRRHGEDWKFNIDAYKSTPPPLFF